MGLYQELINISEIGVTAAAWQGG